MGCYKNNVYMWAGITIILSILIHLLYKYMFRNKKSVSKVHEIPNSAGVPSSEPPKKTVTDTRPSGKNKKRAPWKGKSEFNHRWMLKNLKGHPGNVQQVDFSANGKFMAATCDETIATADSATDSEYQLGCSSQHQSLATQTAEAAASRMAYDKLVDELQPHLLTRKQMWALGYPLEIEPNSGKAAVYINPPKRPTNFTIFDVNAPEFVPGSQSDSGRGSLGSTPRSESDEEVDAVEHLCVRCDKRFLMTRDGEYVVDELCFNHWGRMGADTIYNCCRSPYGSRGCTFSRFHVWSGTKPGMNGPLEGYVQARTRRGGVYALDTEMCYTTAGLELASIAVIKPDGRLLYKTLVKPSSRVVDCNTRFSGIRPRDLARATKTLRDIQNDILGFIGCDTILIGHALENDLRALKLIHSNVVDTSAMYPHFRGYPLRRSLRSLSEELLGRKVQQSSSGHSPLEDARAALDLVLLKINNERNIRIQNHLKYLSLQPYDPLVSSA